MPKTKFITKPPRGLEWLIPMFKRLEKVIDRYVDSEKDPPYWNREETNRSLLVHAAAQAGFITLAEYPTKKKRGRYRKNGRCDLYLTKRNRGRYPWLEIETKAITVHCPKSPSSEQEIEKKAKYIRRALWAKGNKKRKSYWTPGAVEDARRLVPKHPSHQAGLVFVTLGVLAPKTGKLFWQDPRSDMKTFERIFGASTVRAELCWVWWNAKADDNYRWEQEKFFYPGLAIFLSRRSAAA